MLKNILVSDFDGTMTRFDFYDLACQAFPEIAGDFWNRYERGEVTHFEGLRQIFAGIRTSEEKLLAIIKGMEIDPDLSRSVDVLRRRGWDVVVASAGCDWYIKRLLAGQGVALQVHANPGEFFEDKGLVMRLPDPSPFFSPELGVNKVAVVREALKGPGCVAFAGDGRPDLAPALLVPPRLRFAKAWLAKKLIEIGEDFRPFTCWNEIPAMLIEEPL